MSVSLATRGQTDMRGLGTAGRCFRQERDRVSSNEHHEPGGSLLIGVSRVAPRAATGPLGNEADQGRYASSTARDQHQPASSRAIATLAMVGFLLRSMNLTHR